MQAGAAGCRTHWGGAAEPTLVNSADAQLGGFAPRPEYRPLTKFENRGLRLGHGVWDVIFHKR